jgi:hypothetical protein
MDNCQNVYIATPLSKYYIEGVTHPVAWSH